MNGCTYLFETLLTADQIDNVRTTARTFYFDLQSAAQHALLQTPDELDPLKLTTKKKTDSGGGGGNNSRYSRKEITAMYLHNLI